MIISYKFINIANCCWRFWLLIRLIILLKRFSITKIKRSKKFILTTNERFECKCKLKKNKMKMQNTKSKHEKKLWQTNKMNNVITSQSHDENASFRRRWKTYNEFQNFNQQSKRKNVIVVENTTKKAIATIETHLR